jgi:hypothetical protein
LPHALNRATPSRSEKLERRINPRGFNDREMRMNVYSPDLKGRPSIRKTVIFR